MPPSASVKKTIEKLDQLFDVDTIPDDQWKFPTVKKPNSDDQSTTKEFDPIKDQESLVPVNDPNQYIEEDQQIKDDIDDDYKDVRSNIKDLIGNSNTLLELALQVAMSNEDSKSIDSATKLIGQIANLNSQLLDMTAKKQDVYIKARPKVNSKFADALNGDSAVIGNVTNNTMFVGSVTDLLKQIQNTQQNDNDIIEVNQSES